MNITLHKSFTTAVTATPRVLETAAMFGLGVDDAHRIDIVPPTQLTLPQPGVVFITGPSGSGKSTVLALIAEQCRQRNVTVIDFDRLPALCEQPLVDVFDLPLERATSLLAMAGLGDAFVMLRKPSQLSDGQRYRLRLAHAMHLAGDDACVILADEFGATLDRLTACIIARNVRKWVTRTRCAFICATTHDDLLEPLQPDVLIDKGLGDVMHVVARGDLPRSSRRARRGRGQEIEKKNEKEAKAVPQHNISTSSSPSALSACSAVNPSLALESATLADYHALAAFHYKGDRPGVVSSAFRLVHHARTVVGRYLKRKDETTIVGVLLRSLPHLACSLRNHATSNRYRGISPRQGAAMLNREVRTISRVVIHPQWRGLGLAVDLVKHALANPEPGTVYTEALAAMGRVHPFFEKAGMTRYERPPLPAHARLMDVLAHLGIEPTMLASPRLLRQQLESHDAQWRLFVRELRCWHRAGARRSGSSGDASIDDMLRAARDQLVTLPVYYLYRHETAPVSTVSEAR